MPVPVMKIRIVRMRMDQGKMFMHMRVGLTAVPWFVMLMLMVLIVPMCVGMNKTLVTMYVRMSLSHMQPYPDAHHARCHPERGTRPFGEDEQRHGRAEEGRDREIGAGSRRTQMAQRPDKQT